MCALSSLTMPYAGPVVAPKPRPENSQVSAAGPEAWVDEYGDYLYSYALLRLRDRELAEEIVQETFLAALKAYRNFAGQSSEKTWLVGILKHKIVDHFRRAGRERPVANFESTEEDSFLESGDWAGHWAKEGAPKEWTNDPSQLVEQQDFMNIFKRCLEQLPPRLAEAFTLREIDGCSSEEICDILAISPNNLWVMLHRARALLRRSLELNWLETVSSP